MPVYTVQYVIPLTSTQKAELAELITVAHATRFGTPRLFVNVQFKDISAEHGQFFVGGKVQEVNYISGDVRSGPSRTQKEWDNLTREIANGWDRIVVGSGPRNSTTALHLIFVTGGAISIVEQGFTMAGAGGDKDWMKSNWAEFQKRADDGDEQFKDMIQDILKRGLLRDAPATNGHSVADF